MRETCTSGLKRAEAAGYPAPPLLDCWFRGSGCSLQRLLPTETAWAAASRSQQPSCAFSSNASVSIARRA